MAEPGDQGYYVGADGGTLADCPFDIGSDDEKEWTRGWIYGQNYKRELQGTYDHTPAFYHDLAEREGRIHKPMTIRKNGVEVEVEDPDFEPKPEPHPFFAHLHWVTQTVNMQARKHDDDFYSMLQGLYKGITYVHVWVDEPVQQEPDLTIFDDPPKTLIEKIRDSLLAKQDNPDKIYIPTSIGRPKPPLPVVKTNLEALEDRIARINRQIWVPKGWAVPKNDW